MAIDFILWCEQCEAEVESIDDHAVTYPSHTYTERMRVVGNEVDTIIPDALEGLIGGRCVDDLHKHEHSLIHQVQFQLGYGQRVSVSWQKDNFDFVGGNLLFLPCARQISSGNYISISRPADGTRIFLYGTSNYREWTEEGIRFRSQDSLIFEHRLGSPPTDGEFFIVSPANEMPEIVPNRWLFICNVIEDTSGLDYHRLLFGNGNLLDSWHDVEFDNGWSNLGHEYDDVSFYKDVGGFVHLRGLAVGEITGRPIFTLPQGYVPSKFKLLPAQCGRNTTALYITETGEVFIIENEDGMVSFDGISFEAGNTFAKSAMKGFKVKKK